MPNTYKTISEALSAKHPIETLVWTTANFQHVVLATALGRGSILCIKWIMDHGLDIRVVTVDTGYLFPEMVDFKRSVEDFLGVSIQVFTPTNTTDAYEKQYGGPLYVVNPARCCMERKIEPFLRSINGADAWITGLRRDQSVTRAESRLVEWDRTHDLVKVNPLAHWTQDRVRRTYESYALPTNPLWSMGYQSVGCWPCTAPGCGRDGRWPNSCRLECGLHAEQ